MDELQVGKRVRAFWDDKSCKGTIEYVDWPTLYCNHFYPVQVLLDEPHDPRNSTSRTLRFNLKQLKPVKKGRRKYAKGKRTI